MIERRQFLGWSLAAVGGIFVPRWGRWYRPNRIWSANLPLGVQYSGQRIVAYVNPGGGLQAHARVTACDQGRRIITMEWLPLEVISAGEVLPEHHPWTGWGEVRPEHHGGMVLADGVQDKATMGNLIDTVARAARARLGQPDS